jgi:hypothetical protein
MRRGYGVLGGPIMVSVEHPRLRPSLSKQPPLHDGYDGLSLAVLHEPRSPGPQKHLTYWTRSTKPLSSRTWRFTPEANFNPVDESGVVPTSVGVIPTSLVVEDCSIQPPRMLTTTATTATCLFISCPPSSATRECQPQGRRFSLGAAGRSCERAVQPCQAYALIGHEPTTPAADALRAACQQGPRN